MKHQLLFIKFVALVATMTCALGMQAAVEAYACYTPDNTTLTFYYDDQRSTRPGTTYDLGFWSAWYDDGISANVTKVVFNSSFANARPTYTQDWFSGMSNLESITDMEYLNTSEVIGMGYMFNNCEKLESLDVSHFNTAKVLDMSYMFRGCKLLTSLNLSNFNTSSVTSMHAMFWGCEALTSLDLSSFNTAKVIDMSMLFLSCSALKDLDVSNFNTDKVTTMVRMFDECVSLTSLDLSSFNTDKVTDMGRMFFNCYQLKTIYVGDGWSTAAVTNSNNMFFLCTSLVGGKGTTYDANHVDKAYAHIDGGPSNPGYFSTIISLDEALNVEDGNIHFKSTGGFPWQVVQEGSNLFAKSSNEYEPNSTSTLTATVNLDRASTLSFDFKAWGESSSSGATLYDKCIFTIDDTDQFIYGAYQNDWETYSVDLPAGTHTLTWSYTKDGSVNPTGDYFAVDNVAITELAFTRGDVNCDGNVSIADVTTLIDILLSGSTAPAGADCNQDGSTTISDVTTLIDFLLSGSWN